MSNINLYDRRFDESPSQESMSTDLYTEPLTSTKKDEGILTKAEHKVENTVGDCIGKFMSTICCCCGIVALEVAIPLACAWLCCKQEAAGLHDRKAPSSDSLELAE